MPESHDDDVDGGGGDGEDPITTVAIPGVATAVLVAIAGEVLRPIVPDTLLRRLVALLLMRKI